MKNSTTQEKKCDTEHNRGKLERVLKRVGIRKMIDTRIIDFLLKN